jgi:hypothetical protein
MWHRLSRTDFDKTSQLMGRSAVRHWSVCDEYELKRLSGAPEGNVDSYVVVPKYPYEPAHLDKWTSYEPLEATPDLFLKFARLHEAEDQIEAMVSWVSSYGELGNVKPFQKTSSWQYGRPFSEAVGQAARVLALYEAVLNGDSEKVKTAIFEEFPVVGGRSQTYDGSSDKPVNKARERLVEQISESVEGLYGGDYHWYALATAAGEVEEMVSSYCSPVLLVEEGSRTPSGVTARWNFQHLLGAMYLQMYWLMAAGHELTRCEHCGRLISLARPHPEGRKRRQDKRFCDDACRQARHRIKKRNLADESG